jgi:MoaA/NifB/PqqE/SkfB family radical SAM enzyme
MIDGIENPMCKPCYDSERLGLYSKRQRETNDWSKYSHLMESPIAPFEIRHLDVRFDNVCNFKCRYCSPWLSHSWATDYKKLGWDIKTVNAINVNGPDLLTVIKDNCIDNLESVFFCGGEPLLMDQHLELLQLLDSKQMYNTKLLYISNLSKLKYKGVDYIELWNKFNDVNLHFSLDCIGPKLEYIRCGAKWTEIEKNIRTVFEYKDKLKPKIGITVTMYNAIEVLDTVKFLTDTVLTRRW